jgi:hypothetical protein
MVHPGNLKPVIFEAPLPEDFEQLLAACREGSR